MIQHENLWKDQFKFSGFLKDKAWFKIVAHGIPVEVFNHASGLELLKQEIEIFNGIHPLAVNWLSTSQNRQLKKHGSIVIAFDTEAAAQKAAKQRLLIAGISVRTAKYEEKLASEQCQKCQKFGHTSRSCKNLPICQLCADSHPTRLHSCNVCEITGQICFHTVLKCSNCSGNHAANSLECNTVISAKKLDINTNANANQNATATVDIDMAFSSSLSAEKKW